ncbi:tRNA (5-methylaminomethyl-2-thiouridine)(34)-methyltransferase MnmD [Polaribacter sp. MED152]|uniref:tRNA (5-methylaminomethyl-2-thiouridine)(34)-methyltransferase MnmD n=1 Tax=Polaribacter sp. MED152 TaxID=313598 RepID=UPI0000689AC7|nr:tRNA (5-methylaminomethyl-2-thiouridine)(34)-methyltransferase MnmD [Polaribacter sp. MED152]EAQ40760.1 protein of unknown function (DUF752) [Polaribacter sp. MED152]
MKREIFITSDGSTSIHLPDWDEQYHSKHGAIQEAKHVFIKTGLHKYLEKNTNQLAILEIGFGTGLNAFITYLETKSKNISISYVGAEAYPIAKDEVISLNYVSELKAEEFKDDFNLIHNIPWEENHKISDSFSLLKRKQFFQDIDDVASFDLIYFDAFGAKNQPELWTEAIFKKMYIALKQGGILTTYSAKGSVRRAMQAVGFIVERLEGPPGKREMLRATKS